MKTYYVTKYALSRGIYVEECTKPVVRDQYGEWVKWGRHTPYLKVGRDCFETKEDAVRRVKHMAVAKIHSLQGQIIKLRELAANPKWAE